VSHIRNVTDVPPKIPASIKMTSSTAFPPPLRPHTDAGPVKLVHVSWATGPCRRRHHVTLKCRSLCQSNYNFVCFIWVWNLVAHIEGGM
jgi:hypothetical protein